MQPLTPAHVQAVLDQLVPGTQIRYFDSTTATSQQAADNIGCQLGQIVKSICFLVELDGRREPVIVLTSGDQRVDDRRIAELYGVGRKKVKAADADELVAIFGYPPGSVPPVGHRQPIRTLIDATLARWDMLYAAGGAHNAIFPITLAALEQASGGERRDVVRVADADSSPSA